MIEKFWTFKQISISQLRIQADTFDIVLFSCNHAGAKVIRGYSNSEYDHLGMIVRVDSSDDTLCVYEANGTRNVFMRYMRSLIPQVGDFYKKIVIRKLTFNRTNNMIDKLGDFMAEAEEC